MSSHQPTAGENYKVDFGNEMKNETQEQKEKRLARKRACWARHKAKYTESHAKWFSENRDKQREYFSRYYAEHKDVQRERRVMNEYGVGIDYINEKIIEQDGKCAICGKTEKLVVDHDHETGKIRGMLCNKCNTAIGLLGDSLDGIQLAVNYFTKKV